MSVPNSIIANRSPRRRRAAWLVALATAVAAASGCAYLDVKQRELIWRPSQAWWTSFDPQANGVEELWIPRAARVQVADAGGATASEAGISPLAGGAAGPARVEGERLHGWWWPHQRAEAPVMLYLHGARWNLNGNAFRIARLRNMGFSVLAIDYSGFGKSGGDLPTEEEVYADAEAAWEYLKTRVPEATRRYVFGHSLGGAIAIELAARRTDMAGVIVESTFTSIRDMASTHSLLRLLPIGLILTQRYDSLSRVDRIRVPTLFVHGANDGYVPAWMSERLYERTRGPKRLVLVDGAGHSNASGVGFEQYRSALQEFFGMALKHERATSL
jgi:hypothetical protein